VKFDVVSPVEPAVSAPPAIPGAVAVLTTPSSTYRDHASVERFAEAQTAIFLGRMTPPEVRKRADHTFEVVSTAAPGSLVVRLRGNEVLIADLLRKTNWPQVLELIP
jgi:hypothetical protein